MITGLELAFAVVPLVISATEHHQKLGRKLKLTVSQKATDEELEDFLADLHDEISLLGHTLRCLISDLASLTEEQRERLLSLDREQWKQGNTSAALKIRLGSDAENAFADILGRLLKSLDEVVSERSLRFIGPDATSSAGLFKKLEGFREAMENQSTVHDLRSRLQFTNKQERRRKNIKKISKCNQKLERFVHAHPASIMNEAQKSPRRKAQPPSNRSRRMSQDVHRRISRNWSCRCPSPHEARLGLLKCLMNSDDPNSAMNLDLLVSMTSADHDKEVWLESRIYILLDKDEIEIPPSIGEETNSKSTVRFVDETKPAEQKPSTSTGSRLDIDSKPVCTLIKEAHKNNSSLELVYDGDKLWQSRSRRSRIVLKPEIGIPLKNLLGDSKSKLKLKERRALAVVLSHAILHYCESPWVSDNWNKEHVNFFVTNNGPDLMRPYLATQFEPSSSVGNEETSENMFSHPSPALLSLGILLLELYLLKPIESQWDPEDTDDGIANPNTNCITAEKLLDKIGDDLYEGYRNAIQACLYVDYIGSEGSLSLDDENFRKQVYERVVIPLEDELANGFHVTPEDLGVLGDFEHR